MSSPDSQPQSARQARIAVMESYLNELVISGWKGQGSRQAQLFSKVNERMDLTTTLASVNEKIKEVDAQPANDADASQYYSLKATKGKLQQKIYALSIKIAAEKKAYEEDIVNSVEEKVIRNLQMLIDDELAHAWEEN
ncbi:hypothetical protein RUND412_001666 [Rhizina undulata]